MSGTVTGAPRVLLRIENGAVLAVAVAAYARQGGGWWMFATLFLAPDLSMLGYLRGRRIGAALYDLGHWYVLPLACIVWGAFEETPHLLAGGLIWAAHIGFDRVLGYGLKYARGFGATHLGSRSGSGAA